MGIVYGAISLLIAAVVSVPIQRKGLYGFGTEVEIGTPSQRFFVSPDFYSTETRLFAGMQVRSPFFPPLPHSRTLKISYTTSGFPFVDNMTLAGTRVEDVGLSLVRMRGYHDRMHYTSSQGRLGLGRKSAFARSHNISLRTVSLTGLPQADVISSTWALDLELCGPIPVNPTDKSVSLIPGGSAWTINGSFEISGLSISSGLRLIELDPTADGIEISTALDERLRAILAPLNRDIHIDGSGRAWMACDSDGSYSDVSGFVLRTAEGINLDLSMSVPWEISMTGMMGGEGTGLCPLPFKTSTESSVWRMNPFLVSGIERIVLDARNERIVFQPGVPKTAVSLNIPELPLFSSISVFNTSELYAEARFHPSNHFSSPQYMLTSVAAEAISDGSFLFGLTNYRNPTMSRKSDVKGIYKLRQGAFLRLNPDRSLSLPLIRVNASSEPTGKHFRLEVHYTQWMLSLTVVPV